MEPTGTVTELELPDRESNSQLYLPRKTLYLANGTTEFQWKADGVVHTGFWRSTSVRFTRMSGALREITLKDSGQVVKRLSISISLIPDDEVIGEVINGEQVVHDLYSNEARYGKWNRRTAPHRIKAQQWVAQSDKHLVRAFCNHMKRTYDWIIDMDPPLRDGRETKDDFEIRPQGGVEDVTTLGVKIDAFEVSVNPKYEDGFKSFVQALDQQRDRWDKADAMQNPTQRMAALVKVAQNIRHLGGVYTPQGKTEIWPRSVDVGALVIDGERLALYEPKGNKEMDEDFLDSLFEAAEQAPATAQAAEPSNEELELPEGF